MLIAGKSNPGQVTKSRADLLSVKGFDAGQPVVCLSMDARIAYRGAGALRIPGGAEHRVVRRQRRLRRLRQATDGFPRLRNRRIPAPDTAVLGSLPPTGGSWLAPDRLGGKNVAAW
jgi:hypothetical protein